jgi:hypothetical protein
MVRRTRVKRHPVVLYQPRDEGAWMPLGLAAIAGGLPDEHVVIVDGRFEVAPEARVAELARDAAVLGVGVRTGAPLRDALRVSASARVANPRLAIVWGGPHATYVPQSCLATGVVDACVRGSGEEPFAAVVRAAHADRALGSIPGVVASGGIVPRPAPPPPGESLPTPAYGLLDVERHFEARGARRLDYCGSRGVRPGEGRFVALSADRVTAEIGELAERYRLGEIVFQEEDFFAEKGRVEAIAEALASRTPRLLWQAEARPRDVIDGGERLVKLLARSGCRRLHVRPPAGESLRGAGGEQVLEAALLLRGANLPGRFHLELLEPGPGHAELAHAVALARKLSVLDGRFDTPLERRPAIPPLVAADEDAAGLEGWAGRESAPWADRRAEHRLSAAAFYLREAQRDPGRRPGKHLLRMLSLLRVRLGFFKGDVERHTVEASAVLRTGRPRPRSRAE